MTHAHHIGGRLPAAPFCLLALLLAAAVAAQDTPADRNRLHVVAWQNSGERVLTATTDLLAAFEGRTPGVKVNLTTETWDRAATRLKYWCGSHRQWAPDLVVLPDVWLQEYADQVVPVQDVLQPRDYEGFLPAMLDRCRAGGTLLGLPWIVRSRALYLRTDLLEKAKLQPPQTLAELQQVAKALADPPRVYGLGLPALSGGGALETFVDLLHAHGGNPLDDQGALKLTTKEAQAALRWWVARQEEGVLQPEALTWSDRDLQTAFIEGRIGMLIARPEFGAQVRKAAPELKFQACALPLPDDSGPQVAAEVLVMLRSSERQTVGANFLRFMATAEAQRAMSFMGSLPTHDRQYRQVRKDPDVAPFVTGLEHARGLPVGRGDQAARILDRALWLALSGRVDPATALQRATDEEARRVY